MYGCCWALRPRYKRLVDNIFPEDPEDGLVKANMEKLTFFRSLCSGETGPDRCVLSERLTRELNRTDTAMEAMEQLLLACHCQSINLLMCHTEHQDKDLQDKIRVSGIRGLQGVVRKTVDDELQTEVCFRELLGRAAYGHINNAIKPVLMHLDSHSLWEGRSFAVRCFQIIMYSIQSQHSHLVIQQLLGHLDAHSRSPASVRAGIVEVLSEAAVIEATGSVGHPTVLEVFNTLLRQLLQSVDYQLTGYLDPPGDRGRRLWRRRRCRTRHQDHRFEGSRMIQVMLLKSLLQVSSRYESTNLLTALPCSFLQPLLCFTLMEDPEIRLLVLCILTSLLDRHHNTERLRASLKEERCSRQDNLFIRKHAQRLYRHVFLTCKEESSGRSHYQALFTLLAVVSVELANEEVMLDLIRLTLALQELALSNQESLSVYNRCGVIEGRQSSAPHLLPEDVFSDSPSLPEGELQVDEASLFVQSKISEALTGSSYSTHSERLNTPYTPQITEQITFETLKNAIEDSGGAEEEERRRKMKERFQTAPFEEIAAHCGARSSLLQSRLDQVFSLIVRPPPSPYDFFVSRFSEMCHTEHQDKDLQDNGSPAEQTEVCFRELLGRAAYGHINNAIKPVLMHLDSHSLWEGRSFAVRCFQIIMYSIQSQHSHLVIQQLLGHLDAHSRSPASVRAGIVEVLSEAAVIEATGSVGPTVLEVFNTLLRQLLQSVDYQLTGYLDPPGRQRTSSLEEKTLQDAVIKTIGSRMIQVMLLKSLLQVSSRYESTNLLTALPCSFLQPLLCFTLMEDPEIRLLVLCILTSLLDRHHNTERLRASVTMEVCVLELKEERCSRQDNLFIRKEEHGRSHYQALFTLLAVVSVELANEEVMLDLIRLTLALQELALSNQESLSVYNRCGGSRPLRHIPAPAGELQVDEASLFVQSKISEALTGVATALTASDSTRRTHLRLQKPQTEQITFETLKNAIEDSGGAEEEERRRKMKERFQTAPFEEIAAHCGARSRLDQVFSLIVRPPPSPLVSLLLAAPRDEVPRPLCLLDPQVVFRPSGVSIDPQKSTVTQHPSLSIGRLSLLTRLSRPRPLTAVRSWREIQLFTEINKRLLFQSFSIRAFPLVD
ncbi:hypothetical protein F7725_008843 [Dissostichus mawsoni]|uniref:Protein EFR3 homolog B n=1 Tax=Dissostichus mawsoni TaxID=36200 RepID=A0A7J5Z588_DISMA|nr:hypothetical protein F7725_008843 [Dissostichus mawsoni]